MEPNPADLPFPGSLCHRCRFRRLNGNKRGSIFVMCTEPSLSKYPRQPVTACPGFAPPEPA